MPKRKVRVRNHKRVSKRGKVSNVVRHDRNLDVLSKKIDKLIKKRGIKIDKPIIKDIVKEERTRSVFEELDTSSYQPDIDIYKQLVRKEKLSTISVREKRLLKDIRENRAEKLFEKSEKERGDIVLKTADSPLFNKQIRANYIVQKELEQYVKERPKDRGIFEMIEEGRLEIRGIPEKEYDNMFGRKKDSFGMKKAKSLGNTQYKNKGKILAELLLTRNLSTLKNRDYIISMRIENNLYPSDLKNIRSTLGHEISHVKQFGNATRESRDILETQRKWLGLVKDDFKLIFQEYVGLAKLKKRKITGGKKALKDPRFIKENKRIEKMIINKENRRNELGKIAERNQKKAFKLQDLQGRAEKFEKRLSKIQIQNAVKKIIDLENQDNFARYTNKK